MRNRSCFLASAVLSGTVLVAAPTWAQNSGTNSGAVAAPGTPAQADNTEIVVTGTRTEGRSKLATASPVDVLTGAALRQQGTTELATAIANVAPSIDFPRSSGTDGSDAIRAATLRGLSPDETLVLINGVRAHTSAYLNINGVVGRGAAAVDLNTIPTVALETVEVLRDGASAQYGSDAIAGVINLRLRQARSGGGADVTYGLYDTDFTTAVAGKQNVTGEHTINASAWQGIGFGDDGYITVSGEYQRRLPTNRADLDIRKNVDIFDGSFGDPSVKQYTGWVNFGSSINDHWKIYGWAGYQFRDTTSTEFPRNNAYTSGYVVTDVFGDAFTPFLNSHSKDLNSALGIKGDLGDWSVDANVSYGRNRIQFNTLNTINFSLGNASPINFYDGALTYDQLVGKVDVSRKFDVFQSLNVAFGAEGRREGFDESAGDPSSYIGSGAQSFPGFSPTNAIDRHRENASIYADIEAQITDKLLLGIAGRGEHYSDFGNTGTGKISARYDFSPHFALRGTASTGFRAPSLIQEYFTSITTNLVNNIPVQAGTFPATNPIATALGGKPLQPEKSTNLSVGTVIRFGNFDATIDAYRIHIRDQLALSEIIQQVTPALTPQQAAVNAEIASLLAGTGASAARFFINGVASTTKGIDAVVHYRLKTAGAGIFDFTVAGNINTIDVTRVPTSTSALNPAPVLFGRSRILTIEDGTPGTKIVGTLDWSSGVLGATARVTYYGNVTQPGTTATVVVNGQTLTNDLQTGNKAISDLELRYQPKKGVEFALGASNLFDIYPNKAPAYLNSTGVVAYPYYSPWGFNGRYLYVRAGLHW